MMRSELETFDGLDNRKDIMMLLLRLGSDRRRARFLESLIPHSLNGFAGCPMKVCGDCRPVTAYYMLVSICNELGVSINDAARRLEAEVKRDKSRDHPLAHMLGSSCRSNSGGGRVLPR